MELKELGDRFSMLIDYVCTFQILSTTLIRFLLSLSLNQNLPSTLPHGKHRSEVCLFLP